MTADTDPFGIRSQMPVTKEWIYLRTFEESPLPNRSARNMSSHIRQKVIHGLAKEPLKRNYHLLVIRQMSQLLGFRPTGRLFPLINKRQAIQFLLNAHGRPKKEKSRVVSNHGIFLELARSRIKTVIELPSYISPEELDEKLTSDTWLVFIQDIDILTGDRHALEELSFVCRSYDALFMVDCSYTMGSFEILPESADIDLMVFDGNKWLLCPEDGCFAYIAGHHMAIKANAKQIFEYSYSSPSTLVMSGVFQSLRMRESVKTKEIQNYILNLAKQLAGGLSELGYDLVSSRDPTKQSAMVYFKKPEADVIELQEKLLSNKVVSGVMGGCNVLSPNVFNTSQEIDKTLDILAKI